MGDTSKLLQEEKFYSKLELLLDEVNKRCVSIQDDSKKLCVQISMEVVEALLNKLKDVEPSFKHFYNNRISYVGSFYDGLRVSEATEFDLNLILKIPCVFEKIKVENTNVAAGFVQINVKNAVDEKKLQDPVAAKTWKKWVDENGYLLHNKVLSWWESVLTKVSENGKYYLKTKSGTYEVSRKKSGPANTLHVCQGELNIDIDLVPVVEFPPTIVPPSSVRWTKEMAAPWVAVPKPMPDPKFWRLSFSFQERQIMDGKLHLKYVNRLLKKYRDANKLGIASYYIKTLFLWEAFEQTQKNNDGFWKKPVSYLFVYMLVKLAESLENKTLKFFWHKKMNLYQRIPEIQLINMAGQVRNALINLHKKLQTNDGKLKEFIFKLFGIVEEREQLKREMVVNTHTQDDPDAKCNIS